MAENTTIEMHFVEQVERSAVASMTTAFISSGWGILFTLLASLVLYDQIKYIINRGSIAGPAFKMPLVGPFLESVNPRFEAYLDKWNSGPLSCVSVFHK